jgi:hypothetical protein
MAATSRSVEAKSSAAALRTVYSMSATRIMPGA